MINIVRDFPDVDKGGLIQNIWNRFFNIYQNIATYADKPEELKKDGLAYNEDFLKVYAPQHVTP